MADGTSQEGAAQVGRGAEVEGPSAEGGAVRFVNTPSFQLKYGRARVADLRVS